MNSTGDAPDTTPGDGFCDTGALNATGDPECTLRAAIEEANASAVIDTITFAIPAADPGYVAVGAYWSIQPASALPATTGTLTIDGYTQSGAARGTSVFPAPLDAVITVEVNGTLARRDRRGRV